MARTKNDNIDSLNKDVLPEDENPKTSNKKPKYEIRNRNRAGQTVFGVVPGEEVVFNGEGIAEVSEENYKHFIKIPGYSKA